MFSMVECRMLAQCDASKKSNDSPRVIHRNVSGWRNDRKLN